MTTSAFEDLLGRNIVVDVSSQYVYLGRFVTADDRYLVLEEADVHDLRDTTTTRELYILDVKRHGISVNRRRVLIARSEVVSLSALDDVAE